jgi:hypothetical protein
MHGAGEGDEVSFSSAAADPKRLTRKMGFYFRESGVLDLGVHFPLHLRGFL